MLASAYGSKEALDTLELIENIHGPQAANEAVEKFYVHCFGDEEGSDKPLWDARRRSKQQLWLLRKIAEGGCHRCGGKMPPSELKYCESCHIKSLARSKTHKITTNEEYAQDTA